MASFEASCTSTPLTHPSTPPSSPPCQLKTTTAILLWPSSTEEAPGDTVIVHSSREEAEIWVESVHLSIESASEEPIEHFRPVKSSKNCCCVIA
jgi:hypothetical protein